MPLVDVDTLLQRLRKVDTPLVPNCTHGVSAIVARREAGKSPAIIQASQGAIKYAGQSI